MGRSYRHLLLVATLFFALFLGSCAGLQDSFAAVSSAFRGNTKRNPQNYTLQDKLRYKKYLQLQKDKERDLNREVVKRLKQDDTRIKRKRKQKKVPLKGSPY